MKKTTLISIYLLVFFLCQSCKEKEPSIVDKLVGNDHKYWYEASYFPNRTTSYAFQSSKYTLPIIYIDKEFYLSPYFRFSICGGSRKEESFWGDSFRFINDSTIEFNNEDIYRIHYLTDEMMLLSDTYADNNIRYKLYLHVPDEFATAKNLCDSKNLPSLDSIPSHQLKQRLTNRSSKYWYLAQVAGLESEYFAEDTTINQGRAYIADTAFNVNMFSFTYLDEKGNYRKYYRDNLCSPLFEYQSLQNDKLNWEMLNDSTLRIGNSPNMHILYLTDEMMILSYTPKEGINYYYLYLEAPDEMISAPNICDLKNKYKHLWYYKPFGNLIKWR